MIVPLFHVIAVSAIMFSVGLVGIFTRKDAITVFLCIELLLNAANVAFIGFARANGNEWGQMAALLVIAVAAAEAAVGLSIVIRLSKSKNDLELESFKELNG